MHIVYRQSPVGPVHPSFRALSGRLNYTVRRHKFNEDSHPRLGLGGNLVEAGVGDVAEAVDRYIHPPLPFAIDSI